jgi:N-ATPase, AtpR subunit
MSIAAPLPILELAMTMAVAGFVVGLLYFAALERTVALYVSGRGWVGPLAFTLGRIAAAAVFLAFAAKLGVISLLSAFAGFLLARALALRAARGTG